MISRVAIKLQRGDQRAAGWSHRSDWTSYKRIAVIVSCLSGNDIRSAMVTSLNDSEQYRDAGKKLEAEGFTKIDALLSPGEVDRYAALYDRFLDRTIDAGHLRGDLGSNAGGDEGDIETITQIMWPSHLIPVLADAPAHQRCLALAQQWMGEDMAMDFDMLIDKAPGTDTATPWHQDASYWPDLPDMRAVSFWIALDRATVDNGCMWFEPGSHDQGLQSHWQPAGEGGANECAGSEEAGVAVPLDPGSATAHLGLTKHYTRGNTTDTHRRALIINFRPKAMIERERELGFDHGLTVNERTVRGGEAR